ncbi:MAG: lysylphosphatidylglycerol synthase transmembrane domain-containing protein [Verrucomicrobiota bacterium]|jgi:hypothetical protein
MKKLQALLLTLGIVFLAFLLAKVGPRELWRELALLGWGVIPLMLGEGVAEMIHTLGWRQCLSGPLRSLPWFALFRIRMAGYAINYLTPTAALGGEVTKGVLLAERHPGPEAPSGVIIGKLCLALGHLLFVILGAALVLWRVNLPKPLWLAMLLSGGLIALGMLVFLWLQKYGQLGSVVRWLAAQKFAGAALHRAADELTAVDETMKDFYRERPFGLPLAIAWHLVGYSVGIVQTWLFFHLLHQNASWTVAASIWFLGMWFDLLTFAVPQNLGTLEGTRVVVLKAFGYTALTGVTYGFALRLAQLTWSCIGLAFHAFLVSPAQASRNAGPAPLPAPLEARQIAPMLPPRKHPMEQPSLQKHERE